MSDNAVTDVAVVVQPMPGIFLPRCEYAAMQRRCNMAVHPPWWKHHLAAERTVAGLYDWQRSWS